MVTPIDARPRSERPSLPRPSPTPPISRSDLSRPHWRRRNGLGRVDPPDVLAGVKSRVDCQPPHGSCGLQAGRLGPVLIPQVEPAERSEICRPEALRSATVIGPVGGRRHGGRRPARTPAVALNDGDAPGEPVRRLTNRIRISRPVRPSCQAGVRPGNYQNRLLAEIKSLQPTNGFRILYERLFAETTFRARLTLLPWEVVSWNNGMISASQKKAAEKK
jgi:hypothetical protein